MVCSSSISRRKGMPSAYGFRRFVTCCMLLTFVLSFTEARDNPAQNILQRAHADRNQRTEGCELDLGDSCKTRECFLFLELHPFVILPKTSIWNRTIFEERQPFLCAEYKKYGIDGQLFELMRDVWNPPSDYLCYFGGTQCTWNNLLNFVSHAGRTWSPNMSETPGPYKLVLLGTVTQTPWRRKLQGRISAAITPQEFAIVGRSDEIKQNVFRTLKEPLEGSVWTSVLFLLLLSLVAGFLLKHSDPRKTSAGGGANLPNCLKHGCLEGVVDAFGLLFDKEDHANCAGSGNSPNSAKPSDDSIRIDQNTTLSAQFKIPNEEEFTRQRLNLSFQTDIYRLVRISYSVTISLFFLTFVMLYEAALTNFLFTKESPSLDKSITELTDSELAGYTVLMNSADDDVFAELQRTNRLRPDPDAKTWHNCRNYTACVQEVIEGRRKFTLTTKTYARYAIKDPKLCEKLAIFSTRSIIYSCNVAFFYSPTTSPELMEEVDLALIRGKLTPRGKQSTEKFVHGGCDRDTYDIEWNVVIVPITSIICISIIFIAILVILIARRRRREEEKLRRLIAETNSKV